MSYQDLIVDVLANATVVFLTVIQQLSVHLGTPRSYILVICLTIVIVISSVLIYVLRIIRTVAKYALGGTTCALFVRFIAREMERLGVRGLEEMVDTIADARTSFMAGRWESEEREGMEAQEELEDIA